MYMTWWLFNEWAERDDWEKIVVFANTGKEVEGTLFFVDECSQEWCIPIVWVEARFKDDEGKPYSEKGWAVKHRVITYETASRKGEPFEEMISLLGIPSSNAPFCSKQLKRLAIESYAKSIGWTDYMVASGIRVDENRPLDRKRCIYPFIDIKPTYKIEVLLWWSNQPFNLAIHPDDGNCDNCWKKNTNLLVRNIVRKPEGFLWWEQMEKNYGCLNPRNIDLKPPFNFFRGNKSVSDIRELAKLNQAELKQMSMFEPLNPCGESCEAF